VIQKENSYRASSATHSHKDTGKFSSTELTCILLGLLTLLSSFSVAYFSLLNDCVELAKQNQ